MRESATKVLKEHWKKIEELDRQYAENPTIPLRIQIEHMKKQCLEIMHNVVKHEEKLNG